MSRSGWPRHYLDNPDASPFPGWTRKLNEDSTAITDALACHLRNQDTPAAIRLCAGLISKHCAGAPKRADNPALVRVARLLVTSTNKADTADWLRKMFGADFRDYADDLGRSIQREKTRLARAIVELDTRETRNREIDRIADSHSPEFAEDVRERVIDLWARRRPETARDPEEDSAGAPVWLRATVRASEDDAPEENTGFAPGPSR